jgi:iron complex outermembrane receptor protein
MKIANGTAICLSALTTLSLQAPVSAQTTEDAGVGEIIVTAQKRQQSINDIGMSINAVDGEQLIRQGITQVEDLSRIVPGLTVQKTAYGVPVYTMRGVGFFETSLAATPAVSVYTDEVPLPYSAMTRLAIFDIERVEALKGPQGTLFGQNATGGAINYIASKPTDSLAAGGKVSIGRFGRVEAEGYLSGPLSDTLRARIALGTNQGGDWQKSYTRKDKLGSADQIQTRASLDWTPTDTISSLLSVNYWRDKSDTIAPQLIAITPAVPSALLPGIANYPLSPANNRAADWTPGVDLARNDKFVQLSLRSDVELSDDVKLTSITSYAHFDGQAVSDNDGTIYDDPTSYTSGSIKSFQQELRLSGETDKLKWIAGVNYERDTIHDRILPFTPDGSNTTIFGIKFDYSRNDGDTEAEVYAAFGNLEYEISSEIKVYGGARYTQDKRKFAACTYDVDGGISAIFTVLSGATEPLPAGACVTLNASFQPAVFRDTLKQDNVSWRAGVEWRPGGGRNLLYASVSKGYKAGSFPTAAASFYTQFLPVGQESVIAYEAGGKFSLLDRNLQLNGALFYYDYSDKQLRGKINDPIFGPLDALVSVPKSTVKGIELQAFARPFEGLTLNVSATYVRARIKDFIGYDSAGAFGDYSGTKIPYTPKLQLVGDAEYRTNLSGQYVGFIGGSVTHSSKTSAGIGEPLLFNIDSSTLADLRIGVETDKWTVMLWGRNIFNKYYWTNVTRQNDTTYRFAGMPATFGATFRFKLP